MTPEERRDEHPPSEGKLRSRLLLAILSLLGLGLLYLAARIADSLWFS